MINKIFTQLLALALVLQISQVCLAESKSCLMPGQIEHLVIPKAGFFPICASNVPANTTVMLQLHSQVDPLTLCSSLKISRDSCKEGTNIGIYAKTVTNGSSVLWYVQANSSYENTKVVAYLQKFMNNDPLPGACNQVFNLENDPNVQLTYDSYHRVRLFFQWANLLTNGMPDCETAWVNSDLDYDIYVHYLDEGNLGEQSFLDGVSKMMRISDIYSNGQMVGTFENGDSSKPEVYVVSEPSRGAVYSVVVKSHFTGSTASYVTAVTYSCDLETENCSLKTTAGEIIIIVICGVVGLYLLTLGHRMFHISQFVFGYMASFFIVFLLMNMGSAAVKSVIFGIAGCMGVIGGGLCLLFWYYCFFPIASVLIPGLVAGYLVASTLFFTPFNGLKWWVSNENYALAFICAMLVFAVFLMAFTKFLSILSSSLVGSYLVLMTAAVPLHSSLRLVYLYTEYRQTVPEFVNVKTIPPMSSTDIALFTIWPVLIIMGVVIQYVREKGRPDFERLQFRRKIERQRRVAGPEGEVDQVYDTDTEATEADSSDDNERTRLLPSPMGRPPRLQRGLPSYQSVQDS